MIDISNYDENNIFAKILKKKVPSKKIYEDDKVYAFEDINPQAPIHVLIIPKAKFCSFNDFCLKANNETICSVIKSIEKIANTLKLNNGYRIISNIGKEGGQEVPHLHFHLLGGKQLGKIID
tara:strand:+ start:36 stop:401 length:366 start_codon:yes stop_codon:yes gene_type:complete